ncbi:MAG TPA: NAD(P)-dependent oxidoreductase [Pseudolabrys sp.]|nr:NAD(P)-dependent oxidoreductase [Pseudolabrys sp.]
MTRHVLLTGGTGFVGRQVLTALAKAGVHVRVVLRAGSEARIPSIANVEDIIFTNDIFAESADWWANACSGVDTVVHVAWYAEPGKYLQSARNLDCLEGTLRLARGAAQRGVRRFVGVGTCFEYDLTGGVLTVDTPLRPLTSYAGTKAATFQALSQWLPAQGVDFAWCRLFYLYGDGEDKRRLVPYIRACLAAGEAAELTTGKQIRDFLDVREAGRLIAEISLSDHTGPVNVCSGMPVTVRELAESIADEYGRRDLLRFGARLDNLVDPPKVLGVKHEIIN